MIVELNDTTWVESANVTSMKLYEDGEDGDGWLLEVCLIDRDSKLVRFPDRDEARDAAVNMGKRVLFTRSQVKAHADNPHGSKKIPYRVQGGSTTL